MTVLIAIVLSGSAVASDSADLFRTARAELIAGRWADARIKFEESAKEQRFLGWAKWGSGCASTSLAYETADVSKRRELAAAAIRSFRDAVRSVSDSSERAAVLANIGVVFDRLEAV